jgi:hypothetical protein
MSCILCEEYKKELIKVEKTLEKAISALDKIKNILKESDDNKQNV